MRILCLSLMGLTIAVEGSSPACDSWNLACESSPDWAMYGQTSARLQALRQELSSVASADQLSQICPMGAINRIGALYTSAFGSIHAAELEGPDSVGAGKRKRLGGTDTVVVKYVNDCPYRFRAVKERQDPSQIVHPLVREYEFMAILNNTEVSPKVYHLSPEATVAASGNLGASGLLGRMFTDREAQCVALDTKVRYLVQERVGLSLSRYIDYVEHSDIDAYYSKEFSKQMIQIARRSVELLRTVHAAGIVHGDIHISNVAFKKLGVIDFEDSDIVLIDFEFAKFFPSEFSLSSEFPLSSQLSTKPLSVWQLQGLRMGPRDDIFRVLLVLAETLSRDKYVEGSQAVLANNLARKGNPPPGSPDHRRIDELVSQYIKMREPMFKPSALLQSAAFIGIESEMDNMVLEILEDMAEYVKSIPSRTSRVDYERILSDFDDIIAIFP